MTIKLTRITSTSCELTKRFTLEGGKLTSSAIAHMTSGSAETVEITTIEELPVILEGLRPNQAITVGIPSEDRVELTTRAGVDFVPNAVARTNEHFRFRPAPALFVIDVDIDSETVPYRTVQDALDALENCSPWLKQAVRVARPSSSSFVGDRGLRGIHVYLTVTSGEDIPLLAERLKMDQWLAGRGRIVISKSGALLVRQLSDDAMYQPSRLIFEAAPVLGEGVTRAVPPTQNWVLRTAGPGHPAAYRTDSGALAVRDMPKIKPLDKRRYDTLIRDAKNAKRLAAKRVALDYHMANSLAAGRDDGALLGALSLRALGDKVLPPSWPVVFEHAGEVLRGTVREALENLDFVLGKKCSDPFDATSESLKIKDLQKAEIVSMHGKPGIWSHKLQEFFAFGAADMRELSTPLDLAAERLAGTIEDWPDRQDKRHSSAVNLQHVVSKLAAEGQIPVEHDICKDHVTAQDTYKLADWLDAVSRVGCSCVTLSGLDSALNAVALRNPVDPWKESILRLPAWDGVERIDRFFQDMFDVATDSNPDYDAAVTGAAQLFFAGIVMRQLSPGAAVPVVPVLVGDQGTDKSLFTLKLAQRMGWPLPTPVAFAADERRMLMAAGRSPIAELCEMSGLGKRENEDIKRWTTDTQDVFRKPYSRREEEHPRRFVLLGTANKNELNRDDTGNRRFLAVECRRAPPRDWDAELPQILAEAKSRFCQREADYTALIRSVPELVKTHNGKAMRKGRGTLRSDLDDLMPPIIESLLRINAQGRTIRSADIRRLLDTTPSGRKFNAKEVHTWLRMRGWEDTYDVSGIYREYLAPDDIKVEPQSNVVQFNPFKIDVSEM
ncbi:hypothetical protein [Xanthomonas phage X2]|nr:hypothetical protein [Xanthomonas phage X2]